MIKLTFIFINDKEIKDYHEMHILFGLSIKKDLWLSIIVVLYINSIFPMTFMNAIFCKFFFPLYIIQFIYTTAAQINAQ